MISSRAPPSPLNLTPRGIFKAAARGYSAGRGDRRDWWEVVRRMSAAGIAAVNTVVATDTDLVAAVQGGRRRRLRGALPALLPAHRRVRARLPARRGPRRGRDAGGVHVGAAAVAPDRRRRSTSSRGSSRSRATRRSTSTGATCAPTRCRSTSTAGSRPAEVSRVVRPRGPDSSMLDKERLDHLRGALDELSDTHHRIIVMRELEGLSYREIGERMELTPAAVESTLFRARRKLAARVLAARHRPPLPAHRRRDRAPGGGPRVRSRPAPARPPRAPLLELPAPLAPARRRADACRATRSPRGPPRCCRCRLFLRRRFDGRRPGRQPPSTRLRRSGRSVRRRSRSAPRWRARPWPSWPPWPSSAAAGPRSAAPARSTSAATAQHGDRGAAQAGGAARKRAPALERGALRRAAGEAAPRGRDARSTDFEAGGQRRRRHEAGRAAKPKPASRRAASTASRPACSRYRARAPGGRSPLRSEEPEPDRARHRDSRGPAGGRHRRARGPAGGSAPRRSARPSTSSRHAPPVARG